MILTLPLPKYPVCLENYLPFHYVETAQAQTIYFVQSTFKQKLPVLYVYYNVYQNRVKNMWGSHFIIATTDKNTTILGYFEHYWSLLVNYLQGSENKF